MHYIDGYQEEENDGKENVDTSGNINIFISFQNLILVHNIPFAI